MLVVISGFSGAGKGTLMKRLMAEYGDHYALSVSATTRAPRPGETDGKDYFFVDKTRFQEMIDRDELLEYARYVDNYYGTPRSYVEEQMKNGRDVILEIEIQGAMRIKGQYPEAVLIFVTPPSAKELKRRLTDRGTESEEVIRKRMNRAADEAIGVEAYDYILINDSIERSTDLLHKAIQIQHMRVSQRLQFLYEINKELRTLE
ncbi:MAG: guanylate kinase [Eubacteriales bacterium]|nr:guanylate kinase [Eubacteriales bacterium]